MFLGSSVLIFPFFFFFFFAQAPLSISHLDRSSAAKAVAYFRLGVELVNRLSKVRWASDLLFFLDSAIQSFGGWTASIVVGSVAVSRDGKDGRSLGSVCWKWP